MSYWCLIASFIFYLNVLVGSRQIPTLCYGRISYDFQRIPDTKIYYLNQYTEMDALNARQVCLNLGADLPSILSKEENDFIYSFLKHTSIKSYHTNGVRLQNENMFRWNNTDIDINLVDYFNWHPRETCNIQSNETHIVIVNDQNEGKWLQVDQDYKAGVLCQIRC